MLYSRKKVTWILQVGVAGEFVGHGIFAMQGKEQWVGWIVKLLGVTPELGGQILFVIGLMDLAIALFVMTRPIKPVLLWAAFWGFATALIRPIMGDPIWDFVERWANWAAPLALFHLVHGKKD